MKFKKILKNLKKRYEIEGTQHKYEIPVSPDQILFKG